MWHKVKAKKVYIYSRFFWNKRDCSRATEILSNKSTVRWMSWGTQQQGLLRCPGTFSCPQNSSAPTENNLKTSWSAARTRRLAELAALLISSAKDLLLLTEQWGPPASLVTLVKELGIRVQPGSPDPFPAEVPLSLMGAVWLYHCVVGTKKSRWQDVRWPWGCRDHIRVQGMRTWAQRNCTIAEKMTKEGQA